MNPTDRLQKIDLNLSHGGLKNDRLSNCRREAFFEIAVPMRDSDFNLLAIRVSRNFFEISLLKRSAATLQHAHSSLKKCASRTTLLKSVDIFETSALRVKIATDETCETALETDF